MSLTRLENFTVSGKSVKLDIRVILNSICMTCQSRGEKESIKRLRETWKSVKDNDNVCCFTKDDTDKLDLPPGYKAQLKVGKVILLGEPELAVNFGLETKQTLSKRVTYFRLTSGWKFIQNCLLLIFDMCGTIMIFDSILAFDYIVNTAKK